MGGVTRFLQNAAIEVGHLTGGGIPTEAANSLAAEGDPMRALLGGGSKAMDCVGNDIWVLRIDEKAGVAHDLR